MNKKSNAMIDVSVICMKCEAELYSGAYQPGLIGKLKKKIHKSGWIHHPTEGTLCPECAKKITED